MFVRAYDIIKKMNFDLIICDEGHRLKNTAIKTTSVRSFKSVIVMDFHRYQLTSIYRK